MAESTAFFFCILMNFYFVMYYIFYTLTYEYVGKIQKRKRKLNTHIQLHTDKKERQKHAPVPSSLFT